MFCIFHMLPIKSSPIVKIEATIYWYGGYGVYEVVIPYAKKGKLFITNPQKYVSWITNYDLFLSEYPIPKQISESTVWNGLTELQNSPQEDFCITEKDMADLGKLLCNENIAKEYPDSLIKDMASKLESHKGRTLMNILEKLSSEHSSFELRFYMEDNSIIKLKQRRDYCGYPWNLTISEKVYVIRNCDALHFISKLKFEKEISPLGMGDLLKEVCTKLLKQKEEDRFKY